MNLLPAIQAVARAEAAGFRVILDERGLRLSGPTSAPADLVNALRPQKPAILVLGRLGLLAKPGLCSAMALFQPRAAFLEPNNGSQRGDEVADLTPAGASNPQRPTPDRSASDTAAWRKIAEAVLNGDYADAERQTLRTIEIGLRCYNDPVSREALAWIRRRLGRREARPP